MNPLEKIRQKYGPAAGGPGADEDDGREDRHAADDKNVVVANGWRACGSIVALREYLDGHPELGAVVGLSGGGVVIRFNPGIDNSNGGERMRAAFEAAALLVDAKQDILRLVAAGEMRIRRFDEIGKTSKPKETS